jgi:predicted cupin superfamily sugar epimerase
MLTPDQPVSHLHRLKSDEIWHFYAGKPITIVEISNGKVKKTVLGNDLQQVLEDKMVMTHTVKAGVWFGSYLNQKHEFAVVGCTVVPGFDFNDFEVLYQNKVDGFEIPIDL